MLARADLRTISQLLSDTGTALTSDQVLASATLTTLLQEASGIVETAATQGGVYVIDPNATPPINDLAFVQANNGNAAALLSGIVCRLTLWLLWERRPQFRSDDKPPPQAQWALELLEDLRLGKRVLGILERQTSGVIGEHRMTREEYRELGLPSTVASRYFGRNRRRPFGGSGDG